MAGHDRDPGHAGKEGNRRRPDDGVHFATTLMVNM
jgi:hypothetical protein